MPVSATRSAEAASLPSSRSAAAAASSASETPSLPATLPIVGQRWGRYEIVAALPAEPGVEAWQATDGTGGREVVIRRFKPADRDARALAWKKLSSIDAPTLQHVREAEFQGDVRLEVADLPSGTPLPVWRAMRPACDVATIKAIVSQLADGLGALHASELVHLDLRPDVVFVSGEGAELRCVIAGLDSTVCFDRTEPVRIEPNPLYAPPEAFGLQYHVPGLALCSWDWWSLGRIVQELVLGQHIVGLQLNVDTRPLAGPVREKAESLLREEDPKAPRAGAVETMPAHDPALTLLLRGLLTSAREARWTGDHVDRWIRGLAVKENYLAPRTETHFRWRGRPFTVPEFATLLQSAEHWPVAAAELFEPGKHGTFAHFLRHAPAVAAATTRFVSALELAESLPLKLSSPAAQREAVTMMALLQLSEGKLLWRGRPLESATLAAMIAELGETDALAVVRGLTTRSTAIQVERIDAEAGRVLTELGRVTTDVENFLRRHGWLGTNDTAGSVAILRLALEPIPALRATRDALVEKFAGSDHAAVQKVFAAANPSRAELVVLAIAAATPERFKFFSHDEAARRKAEALRARGAEIVGALTWVQWERALAVGRTVFAGWGWFFLTWMIVGIGAVLLWPGPLGLALAPTPLILALLLRIGVTGALSRSLTVLVPEAHWTWRDGPASSRRQFRVAGRGVARAALEAEFQQISSDLALLGNVQPAPAPIPPLPRFAGVRAAGLASWTLVAACVVAAGWRMHQQPPTMKAWKTAWSPPPPQKTKAELALERAQKAAAEDKHEEVKVSWPYRAGDSADKANVRATQPASATQLGYAQKHGRDLVKPYLPDTIDTLIIMPVPAAEGEAAVMVFDGKRQDVLSTQVYQLDFRPMPRTWVDVGGHKGIYLDQ